MLAFLPSFQDIMVWYLVIYKDEAWKYISRLQKSSQLTFYASWKEIRTFDSQNLIHPIKSSLMPSPPQNQNYKKNCPP